MRAETESTREKLTETCELLRAETDSAIRAVGRNLMDAEDRLKSANEASLAEHAALLARLDASTRANAQVAETSKTIAGEAADNVAQLRSNVREDLGIEIRNGLTHGQGLLDARFKDLAHGIEESVGAASEKLERQSRKTAETLAATSAAHERLIREEIDAFKAEMRQSLLEHQRGIDGHLTDFLNRQNALVQNLTQRIDSYHGLSQALSAEVAAARTQLRGEVDQLETVAKSQREELQQVSARVEDLIQKLRGRSFFTGVK